MGGGREQPLPLKEFWSERDQGRGAGARHGLYPHNGLRVRKEGSRYVLFDELTPLSPGEDSVRQQQWSLERGGV